MLWVEGHMSSYFLLVKMSIPTRLTYGEQKRSLHDAGKRVHLRVRRGGTSGLWTPRTKLHKKVGELQKTLFCSHYPETNTD